MNFSFVPALDSLGSDAGFRIANEARPSSKYLLNSVLPERNREDYDVERGKMIVRSTMAGLVAMDSPYPMGGYVEIDTQSHKTAKVGISVPFSENTTRTLQRQMQRLGLAGGNSTESLVQEVLNFYNLVILQSHFDMAEWMRGQALMTGALSITQNGKAISVDYGVPSANKFDTRTTSGGTAYGASSSKFWDDWRSAKRILRGGVSLVLMTSATRDEIVYNAANAARVISQSNGVTVLQRMVTESGVYRPSEDARDTITIVTYDAEAHVANPATNGYQTVQFIKDGYVIFVGKNQIKGYEVGQGSQPDPDNDLALGYTHIAPTVEGGGQPGRWGRIYVPEKEPWKLIGEAAANLLPVIEAPDKLVIAHTEMSA